MKGIHWRIISLVKWTFWKRHPRDPKTQESKRPRPELILWVAIRGTAFLMGKNRWSAGRRLESFLRKPKSEKKYSKDYFNHQRGEKLCRVKPKNVGS
jgi:hypothetical protein